MIKPAYYGHIPEIRGAYDYVGESTLLSLQSRKISAVERSLRMGRFDRISESAFS